MRKPVALLISVLQVAPCVVCSLGIDEATAAEKPASASPKQRFNADGVSYSLEVEIAAGAAGDDALAQGVHLFRLKCSADLVCSLQRVTLNECVTATNGVSAFSPRVDLWTTTSGQLAVRRSETHEIELTVYQAYGKKLPATAVLTFASGQSLPFSELTGFKTAGFIDLRFWPEINHLIEYVPVQKDRAKPLDCPVSLRGLKH